MKVLISAYICAPHRGSEPGAGWNWSLAAAEDNEVWVITRERNRAAIEAELAAHPHPRLHFVYVELPPWGLRLKKGERGIRYFSYYTLWQLAALRTARKLHAELGFDLVHHVTFANMWLPALVGFVEAPFVLGPVGGGPRVPLRLYPELGAVGAAREAARVGLQAASRFNPLTRASWSRATTIVVQNQRDTICASQAPSVTRRRSTQRVAVRQRRSPPRDGTGHGSGQARPPGRPPRPVEGRLSRASRDRANARLVSDGDRKRPRSRAADVLSPRSSAFSDRVTFIPVGSPTRPLGRDGPGGCALAAEPARRRTVRRRRGTGAWAACGRIRSGRARGSSPASRDPPS